MWRILFLCQFWPRDHHALIQSQNDGVANSWFYDEEIEFELRASKYYLLIADLQ